MLTRPLVAERFNAISLAKRQKKQKNPTANARKFLPDISVSYLADIFILNLFSLWPHLQTKY